MILVKDSCVMEYSLDLTDNDLPGIKTVLLRPTQSVTTKTISHSSLRRSPRKHAKTNLAAEDHIVVEVPMLSATSNQRRQSPAKRSPTRRSQMNPLQDSTQEVQAAKHLFSDVPSLPKVSTRLPLMPTTTNKQASPLVQHANSPRLKHVDSLLLPLSKMALRTGELTGSDSEPSYVLGSARPKARKRSSSGRSVMSLMTEAARKAPLSAASPTKTTRAHARRTKINAAKKFVLSEAECLQDLADSDANNEGEDDDTDLSGFVVDDNAELSYHESMESDNERDSEHERRITRVKVKQQKVKEKPRRRLHRGRRQVVESECEDNDTDDLMGAFKDMSISKRRPGNSSTMDDHHAGIIDLVSPLPESSSRPDRDASKKSIGLNLFDKLNALRLSPPLMPQKLEVPSKSNESVPTLTSTETSDAPTDEDRTLQPTTPPATPPRSPSKLKSPSKLLSPSKRGDAVLRSPHRQSMDAFWDLNVVNDWNDKFSPKKAPLDSPRKGLKYFDLWSDSEKDDSSPQFEESSDGLPSPCESPSKMRVITSPLKSPEKAAKRKAQEEKKAKLAKKKQFDASKDTMARDLFTMLDQHITNGKISKLAESTGGVGIVWSNTLRSTAGRANWKKTRTSSSPQKNKANADEVVRHFASIELAVKVIDRPERLYDTLSHEFCHLANFMISGIVKEPHGAQFQQWAKQATAWLHAQDERPEWKSIKISTRHGYVIEHKYLWVCTGRLRNGTPNEVSSNIENSCGAEYGRHSKSIDPDKHRCGVCHGILLQVRPKPRMSPKKGVTSPLKKTSKTVGPKGIEQTIKEIEIIELSD